MLLLWNSLLTQFKKYVVFWFVTYQYSKSKELKLLQETYCHTAVPLFLLNSDTQCTTSLIALAISFLENEERETCRNNMMPYSLHSSLAFVLENLSPVSVIQTVLVLEWELLYYLLTDKLSPVVSMYDKFWFIIVLCTLKCRALIWQDINILCNQ